MKNRSLLFSSLAACAALLLLAETPGFAALKLFGKKTEKPVAPAPAAPPAGLPPVPTTNALPAVKPVIVWDAQTKAIKMELGERTAHVSFQLTNTSPVDAVVTLVKPSCGCTTAQLPPIPWTIAPGGDGKIEFAVDVTGKSGTLLKTVSVESTAGSVTLQINITMPDTKVERARNVMIATTNRQAVFTDNCARCHAAPATAKMGEELYRAACGICHEATERAAVVPNLQKLQHPTDAEFWRTWIAHGKPQTLMPAFAQSEGGPLTGEQIDSLTDYLLKAIPSN